MPIHQRSPGRALASAHGGGGDGHDNSAIGDYAAAAAAEVEASSYGSVEEIFEHVTGGGGGGGEAGGGGGFSPSEASSLSVSGVGAARSPARAPRVSAVDSHRLTSPQHQQQEQQQQQQQHNHQQPRSDGVELRNAHGSFSTDASSTTSLAHSPVPLAAPPVKWQRAPVVATLEVVGSGGALSIEVGGHAPLRERQRVR
jgi:hypothetical protein